jgi:hypothetical protein
MRQFWKRLGNSILAGISVCIAGALCSCQAPAIRRPSDLKGLHPWEIERLTWDKQLAKTITPELAAKLVDTVRRANVAPPARNPTWRYSAFRVNQRELWYVVSLFREELGQDVFVALINPQLRLHDFWLAGTRLESP